MRYSLSGFLFEDGYATQSLAFEQFCALAREIGCHGVELRRTQVHPGATPSERRGILRVVRGHSLEVSCLTARGMPASGPERDEFFHSYLRLCQDLGCRMLKVGGEPEWMRWAAEEARREGVTVATNNHVGSTLETVEGTRRFFAAVAHQNARLLFDCYHLRVTGEDYVKCIPTLFPLVTNILVHSVRPASGSTEELRALKLAGREWLPCFPDEEGAQDWRAVLGSFMVLGYDGWVTVIESGWPAEQRPEVARRNLAFLRSASPRRPTPDDPPVGGS